MSENDVRDARKGNGMSLKVDGADVYERVPEGWRVIGGATNHPPGLRWVDNRKSRFDPDWKRGLTPEEIAYEWCRDNT